MSGKHKLICRRIVSMLLALMMMTTSVWVDGLIANAGSSAIAEAPGSSDTAEAEESSDAEGNSVTVEEAESIAALEGAEGNAAGGDNINTPADGGQSVNEAVVVWEQDVVTETSEMVHEEAYAEARSTSDTYKPYEGAKYSLKYKVGDEGVVITGITDYEAKYDLGRLEIPAEIDGVKVTSIGESAFRDCSGFNGSLAIPESVTSIGRDAFQHCRGLTGSLMIPEGVTSIGGSAFWCCSGFTGSLTIPKSMTDISGSTFYGCSGLTSLTLHESVRSIGNKAFYGCSDLTSLTIPKSVRSIGIEAFYGCSGLTSLTLLEGVRSIGNEAFYGCHGLRGSLMLPKSVSSIGKGAFYGCGGLTGNLTIPEGVIDIEESAFDSCSGLTSLTLPESVISIGDYAFYDCSGLTGGLTISESVSSIGKRAFCNCSGLTSLTLPESVSSIGEQAFYGCNFGLTPTETPAPTATPEITAEPGSGTYKPYEWGRYSLKYEIGDEGVTITGIDNYESEYYLGRLEIPAEIDGMKVTSIGDRAFSLCKGFIGSLTIPEGVTSIGDHAFSVCNGFKGSLTIPEGVTNIGQQAFYGCRGFTGSLTIFGGVTSIGIFAFDGCKFEEIIVDMKNIPNGMFNGGICDKAISLTLKEGVTSIGNNAFAGCRGFTGSLTIPESVTSIGAYAFKGCSGFTGSLTIPESVTSIGDNAFAGCSGFTGSLTIPESMTSIERYVFSGCSGFTGSLTIPDGVTRISESAFNGCSGLTGSLTIPDGVVCISESAFNGCSGLTSLTIPEGVTSIYSYAFMHCSGLTNLTIPEGMTNIGNGAFFGCNQIMRVEIPASVKKIGRDVFAITDNYTQGSLRTITVLGMDTEIDVSGLGSNITIEGYRGSTAETYAKENNCTFIPLDNSTTDPSVPTTPTYDAQGLAERFYTELLGRAGEADGIAGWTNKLETGELSAIFVGYFYVDGDEFKNLNLTNDEYLERLYKTFMGRASDPDGKAFWLERLDAGFTRDYIYLNFAVLPEFTEICDKSHIRRGETDEIGKLKEASEAYANKNLKVSQYITRCYTKVLNRPADAEGVEFWCGQILTKAMEAKTAAEAYVLSEEFVNRNKTDEGYVEVLYQTFFGRAGDKAGADYWLGQLSNNEMTREDVLHAFSATPEFADILAEFGL